VLGVGGGFAEEDGSGGVFDEFIRGAGDGFPIGLHGELLKVGWEAVKVLIEAIYVRVRNKEGDAATYGETK